MNKVKFSAAAIITTIFTCNTAYCQQTLDTEKYRDSELFAVKRDYDVNQRLQEVEALAGQEVTVYQISGKQNKIKLTYTGIVEITKASKLSDKQRASLITVVTKNQSGRMSAYFPLTNDSNYRIYLTKKMIRN